MHAISDLPRIKHLLYAMRNGVVADALRKQGAPFRMIYGVNLPQLTEIASQITHDKATAQALWDDRNVRECMLLAPLVYPRDAFDEDTAMTWVCQAPTQEVIDILCHKLLRHLDFAYDMARRLSDSESDMIRYAALRLMFNLLPKNVNETKSYAAKELQREKQATQYIARALLDEIEFITE